LPAHGVRCFPLEWWCSAPIGFLGAPLCSFFLMIRRPPRSPPFPYTTLSRSFPAGDSANRKKSLRQISRQIPSGELFFRSEEHTSELQSHVNLVCGLLLEKKKQSNKVTRPPRNASVISNSPARISAAGRYILLFQPSGSRLPATFYLTANCLD